VARLDFTQIEPSVIPAKAGISFSFNMQARREIPAFVGMTIQSQGD
jgi:hypothetical protein